MTKSYFVRAEWDAGAEVWVATSADVPGLVTEAATLEALDAKLKVMVPELLEANGCPPSDQAILYTHSLECERELDGRYLAEVPELPAVLAYGKDADDAKAKAEALALRVLADQLDQVRILTAAAPTPNAASIKTTGNQAGS